MFDLTKLKKTGISYRKTNKLLIKVTNKGLKRNKNYTKRCKRISKHYKNTNNGVNKYTRMAQTVRTIGL